MPLGRVAQRPALPRSRDKSPSSRHGRQKTPVIAGISDLEMPISLIYASARNLVRCVVESYPDERKYEREDGPLAAEDAHRDNDVTKGAGTKVTDRPVGPPVAAQTDSGR